MGIDTANPLGGVNTQLDFQPGGNPYSDISPQGLAKSYGDTYNSALKTNVQNYQNVIGGYKNLASTVSGILGQGGGWGVATPAAQAIADTQAMAKGGAMQNSINKGLGSSTAAVAAQRGANLDAMKAYSALGAQLAQTNAGYTAGIGQSMLQAMQNVNVPYPNAGEYATLYQQYGQQQQAAASMAMLAQQQAAQNSLAAQTAKRNMYAQNAALAYGKMGGGVSVGAAPRGGTYGSGGGSFAAGGGLTPGGFGLPSYSFGGGASATGGGFNYNSGPVPTYTAPALEAPSDYGLGGFDEIPDYTGGFGGGGDF